MDSIDKATGAIPETMPRQDKAGGDGDGMEEKVSITAEKRKAAESEPEQAWNDMISAGLTFFDKLGQTLLKREGQPGKPSTKPFSGLEIETDKATGQRQLKVPMPKKETIQGIVNLLNEFSKKL